MYQNQANNFSTNIFETLIGSLNIAPIKISGQYKIVVSSDGKLFLDDYASRRVSLNINENFLPQVAKFLKTPTLISDTSVLKYGGFQKGTKKSFHIPFYLGSNVSDKKYPEYYVLSRVVNETITDQSTLYKYGKIHQVHNLNKIGLHKIFDQIVNEDYFEFPIYFNWEENNIKLYGYDINKNTPAVFNFGLLDSQANQPYIDVLNNKILNNYLNNGLFFPRFLNVEFEFDYINNYIHFNNFYGFLGFTNEIPIPSINDLHFNIKVQEYVNKQIVWQQENYAIPSKLNIQLNNYIDVIASGSIQEVVEQKPQYKFQIFNVDVNDSIVIKYLNDVDFEYIIKKTDIVKTSLLQTLVTVCRLATIQAGYKYLFSVSKHPHNSSCIVKIIYNDIDVSGESLTIHISNNFIVLDRFLKTDLNYNKFRGISNFDVCLPGQPNLVKNINNIAINRLYYAIVEIFKFEDKTILRLDKVSNIKRVVEAEIYETKVEKLLELNPIPFLSYNSNFKNSIPFEQESYVNELFEMFVTNATNSEEQAIAQTSIEKFDERKSLALNQYVVDDLVNSVLDDSDVVDVKDSNKENILNMFFTSGLSTYLTPNVLNIDRNFYVQNGSIDIEQLTNDGLRYNWFLIKGICPNYIKNDVRSLRYFSDKPKITSRLVKTSENYCETVFLGVKYKLPLKYENYKFATYLDFNTQSDIEVNYSFEVNKLEKTIYLSINKFLDYSDLIRGGNTTKEPLIDLSFFYNVVNSFNSNSEVFENFKTSGIYLCPQTIPNIFFGTTLVFDWKYYSSADEKNYIALFNEAVGDTNDFKLLFPAFGNSTLYIYSTIIYNGNKYIYVSMTITVEGIKYLESDYLWCEDIKIKFYDTKKIFIYRFNELTNLDEILYVDKSSIFDLTEKSTNVFGDYIKIGTILINGQNETYEFLLPDKILSFKEYWFEINQIVSTDEFGNQSTEKNLFRFPEFFLNNTNSDEEIIDIFDQIPDLTQNYKINLFNKNQIWQSIRDIIRVDLKFKEQFENQVRKNLNGFMLTNLIDFTYINSAEIKNSVDEYINFIVDDIDRNIAVWKLLNEKKIVLLNRYSGAYSPFLPLVENEKEFQLPSRKTFNSIFNVYDKNFGGLNINATGLWNEVKGNIVSSLFCKNEDITIVVLFSESIDYKKLLIQVLNIDDCIINGKNEDYIKKINQNINDYILETYASYLLDNFYDFNSVLNQNGQKLKYTVDKRNKNLVYFDDKESTNLTFIFKRK